MSTATNSMTVNKSTLTAFTRSFKPVELDVVCADGLIQLHSLGQHGRPCHAVLCVGEYEGDDVEFRIDAKNFVRVMGQVKANQPATFSINEERTALVVSSDAFGEITLEQRNVTAMSESVFGKLGAYVTTLSASVVAAAATITDRCDRESTRFALSNLLLDEGFIIATDGRRLVTLENSEPVDKPTPIPCDAIDYAAKHSYEIDVYRGHVLAGDLIAPIKDGRFPNWKQVVSPKATYTLSWNGDEIRATIAKESARLKATKSGCEGVLFPAGDGVDVKLNHKFVTAAIGGLKSIIVAHENKLSDDGKELTSPVFLTSNERPGWREVIMPMARDR